MPIEYNKSHMQDILKKNAKIATLHNCIVSLEKSFQKRVHSVSLRFPNTFICFLVFGNRDETLALVFELNNTYANIEFGGKTNEQNTTKNKFIQYLCFIVVHFIHSCHHLLKMSSFGLKKIKFCSVDLNFWRST